MRDIFEDVLSLVDHWRGRGERVLPNGTRLICPTPHIAPQAWLHVLYAPLLQPQIDDLESKLMAPMPLEFKEFLSNANGLDLFSYDVSIWGVRTNFARQGDEAWQPFDLLRSNSPTEIPSGSNPNLIYFANIHGALENVFFESIGGSYRVGVTPRRVFQPIRYWPDFASWLREEISNQEVLFDREGRRIAPILNESVN